MEYELVIGLEVHVQLDTRSKAFCTDPNYFGAEPNTLVSPVSLAHPGTLPRVNREHVRRAILLGLALDCRIADRLEFDRKHYFYPDLPKGYQISQHHLPLCRGGRFPLRLPHTVKPVRLRQIHMEEDAGKSQHRAGESWTGIDLNRAGAPLLEVVTEPDLRSAKEVDALMSGMRRLVRWLGISDGHMEQGSLRCDCNISVRRKGDPALGQRCEIKNLNSMRYARQAIDYEKKRQIALLEKGQAVEQETRLFDPASGRTYPMRDKEEAHDYRYFPEPDLPPISIDRSWVEEIGRSLPELPEVLFERLQVEFGLSAYQADLLSESREVADYFLGLAGQIPQYTPLANWIINQVLPWCKAAGAPPAAYPLPAGTLGQLLDLVDRGQLSHTASVQQLLPVLLEQPDRRPEALAQELGLLQVSDEEVLKRQLEEILDRFPEKVAAYRKGKKGLAGFFMGQLMRQTEGKADPKLAQSLLRRLLE